MEQYFSEASESVDSMSASLPIPLSVKQKRQVSSCVDYTFPSTSIKKKAGFCRQATRVIAVIQYS